MCDERGIYSRFSTADKTPHRQFANQFNVSLSVVGEVPLPTPIKERDQQAFVGTGERWNVALWFRD
jgi:hypothetical protein